MAFRTLFKQISRSLYISGYQATPSAVVTSGRNYVCNGSVIGTRQTAFVKQYSSSEASVIPIVTYEEVKQLPKNPEKLLIDVREPSELQETGQIPTSINIPLGQVAEELALDAGAFKAKYGRDKPQRATEIIFHCKIGRRSQNAAELAKSMGYEKSKNYLGSWTEWAEKEGLAK